MSAALKLEIFKSGQLLQEIPLNEAGTAIAGGGEFWVGRDEECMIRLDDRAISRKHATFRSTTNGVEFEKKSKFGWIKVNGNETVHALLKSGDFVELGPFEIRVKSDEKSIVVPVETANEVQAPVEIQTSGEKSDKTEMLSREEQEQPFDQVGNVPLSGIEPMPYDQPQVSFGAEAQSHYQHTGTNLDAGRSSTDGATKVFTVPEKVRAILLCGDGAANVTEYEINDNEIALGRSQQCHIVLEDKRSSRKHALIKRDALKYFLKDLGSANGTMVNGSRVEEHELQSGDQIQIGETIITFRLVQADYEAKKGQFMQVPPQESDGMANPLQAGYIGPAPEPIAIQEDVFQQTPFQAPPEKNPSLIGRAIERYRAMNTKQQIMWGFVVLGSLWVLMSDDVPEQRARLNVGQKKAAKGPEKKIGEPTFESLSPEQQRYIETQYQLAFELYKNREYDKTILELDKIFTIVKTYKQAQEISAFAREGKRKLEAQEEEKRRKEAEKQAALQLKTLVEQAGMLMDKHRYKEAEALFPEIELLNPENVAVTEWRRQIMQQAERAEAEKEERKRVADLNRQAWASFQEAKKVASEKKYYDALDLYDEILERGIPDKKLSTAVKEEIDQVERSIASERDPYLAQGKQLEQEGKLIEAFKQYEKAHEIDPVDPQGQAGMNRTRETLSMRARSIYAEGVFAESYSDMETAEKRYRDVLEVVPKDDDYYQKAQSRLKKITVFKKPAGENPQ